jgi:hypothetical protein
VLGGFVASIHPAAEKRYSLKFRECGSLEFVLPVIAPTAPNPIGEVAAQDPTYSFSTGLLTVEQPPRSQVIGPRVERELLVRGEQFIRIVL